MNRNQGMVLLKDLEKNQGILQVTDLERDQGRSLPKLLQRNILRGQLMDMLRDLEKK